MPVAKAARDVAVVGVGTTAWGSFPEIDSYALGADALRAALEDAGLGRNDIDGLVVSRIPSYERFAQIVGLDLRFVHYAPAEGRQSGISLQVAVAAIEAGLAQTIALVYGNNGRSRRVSYGGEEDAVWAPWGFTSLGAEHALMFRSHMLRYGTTSDQLAEVALTFRQHAALNPAAVMRKPLDRETYHAARFIVDPLRLYDYCLINDGGVAIIVTSGERARALMKPPAYIRGMAQSASLASSAYPAEDCWYSSLQRCAQIVYEQSGIARSDVDGLMIYDNYSPVVLFALEGMGFAPRGESGVWIQGGRLRLGGEYPTNTNGGHLSESYMQGWALNVEAVRQIRCECGLRQIQGCRAVQYIAATPISTTILYASEPS
ncbi:thiolase family protein [bacterium]|nr:MAG: thiolase family protein [bacterium]